MITIRMRSNNISILTMLYENQNLHMEHRKSIFSTVATLTKRKAENDKLTEWYTRSLVVLNSPVDVKSLQIIIEIYECIHHNTK